MAATAVYYPRTDTSPAPPHWRRPQAVLPVTLLAGLTLTGCGGSAEAGGCPLSEDTMSAYLTTLHVEEQVVTITPEEELPALCVYTVTTAGSPPEEGDSARVTIATGWDEFSTREDHEATLAEYAQDDDDYTEVREVDGVPYFVNVERGAQVALDDERYWVTWTIYEDGVVYRPSLSHETTGLRAAWVVDLLIHTRAGEEPDGWRDAQAAESAEPAPSEPEQDAFTEETDVQVQPDDAGAVEPGPEGGVVAAPETLQDDSLQGEGTGPFPDDGSVWLDGDGTGPFPDDGSVWLGDEEPGTDPSDGSAVADPGDGTDHPLVGSVLPAADPEDAAFLLWQDSGYPPCEAMLPGESCVDGPVELGGEVLVTALQAPVADAPIDPVDPVRDTAVLLRPAAEGWTVVRYWETDQPLAETLPTWAG
ncbi:hypothetical protein [uncultured Serinicoccus sp.]|uniref:hypothetical protein n=1 Tax=uncultured Serinicoccus sp. TaxID=735514 RepID=UPI002631D944|nr:hypothetical protein [uncultured Serinicoccus sp.]